MQVVFCLAAMMLRPGPTSALALVVACTGLVTASASATGADFLHIGTDTLPSASASAFDGLHVHNPYGATVGPNRNRNSNRNSNSSGSGSGEAEG